MSDRRSESECGHPQHPLLAMSDAESRRRFGQVFDAVADEYDAVRRGYPDSLVDECMSRGGLRPGLESSRSAAEPGS